MENCLVIGSTVCDIMIYIDELPKSQQDIHLNDQIVNVGGCAFNVVSVLHNLNVPYTFISPVGKGIYGDFVSKKLKEKGIVSHIISENENGCCYCIVEKNGERTFMSYHKTEYTFNPEWLDIYNLDAYKYIYICGLEVEDVDGEKLVESLSRFKGQIIFAPGPRGNKIKESLMEKIYRHKPIVHLNDLEVRELMQCDDLKKAIIKLFEKTNNTVIVTLGEDGSLYYDGTFNRVDGYQAKVKDTIGAGDGHVGAVMAGLAYGKSLNKALDFANLLASKVVEVSGIELSKEEYKCLLSKLKR